MTESVNYQCPACGGPIHFDAVTGKPTCDYCDSVFTVEEIEQFYAQKQQKADAATPVDEAESEKLEAEQRVQDANAAPASAQTQKSSDPIADYLSSKKELQEGDEGTTCLTCSSCGAQLIVDNVSAVSQCPYCGNTSVNPGKVTGTLEPDYVIPFSTTKQQAIDALNQHYKGKVLLPKPFSDQNHIEEVQGIYVPFWLYSGTSTGEAGFECTNTRVWSDRDYNYTETSIYHAERSGEIAFDKVPVDGSKRMPDDHMDSIEPFDYSKMVKFSTAYLPGFAAERYDEDVRDCADRARSRGENSLVDFLQETVNGYQTVTCTSSTSSSDFEEVSYALLPVWMLHTKWNDEDFLFAMNGQTGKLVGDLPVDKKKLTLISIGTFIASFAVCFGILSLVL